MKTFNTGVAELVFVEVPENSTNFKIGVGNSNVYLTFNEHEDLFLGRAPLHLELETIGMSHELTEEQWGGFVSNHYAFKEWWTNYINTTNQTQCTSAKESGLSTITASGMEQREGYNVLVLKKMI